MGRTVSLAKKPERVVVLSPSFLELLYAVDGKAVGRPTSTAKVGIEAEKLQAVPEVGFVYNVNVEKVVSLQPDLVIAMQGLHEKLIPILESSNIPVVILKYKTYDDVFEKIALMGEIAGTKDKAQTLTQSMQSKLQDVSKKLPDKTTKIAGSRPIDDGADNAPYSLEKLVENDPDMIFVVTMGDAAKIEKTMRDDVESNPAWATLRAVRDKKLVFLPSELFLLNPGLRTPEAAAYMAKLVYPEIYAHD
ncbi:MAG: ABC-type transporter, periplasmic subunit [Anaerospora sp.]|nr:ABC-type transporter, periplasmic subunit [Anaerospora sp.]